MVYVSAQVALYVCGILDARFKHAALRHYLRGLLYCYNYRTIHSNQIQSDSAYPMMRLLSLIFRSGNSCFIIINFVNYYKFQSV